MEVSGRRDGNSFKDSVGKSSAEEEGVLCQPCSSDGEFEVAVGYCQNCNEYFCAACLKVHRKQSVSKHHVILDGNNMPRPEMSQTQLDPCSEPCVQHTNEIMKFYCSSHDSVGCSDCMVLNHKTCKVDRIQDISCNFFRSKEHRELVGKTEKFLNDLEKLKHQVQRNEKSINETCNKAVNDIKTFRKEVNDFLDKEEAGILTQVNKRKQADENMMAKLEADKQSLQNEIKELEEKLNQPSNKANEVFVEAKNLKKRMSFIEATLKQMIKSSQIKQYMFEPSPDVRQIIASHGSLGKLRENTDQNASKEKKVEMVSQSVPSTKLAKIQDQSRSQKKMVDMIPQFEFEINVRAPGELKNCHSEASVIISPSQAVLADINNNSVKLVDIKQRKVLARYGFKTYPSDVAKVSEGTVAVTLPDEHKIQFMSITQNNEFTLKNEIKVNYYCKKLFCEGDKIFVASEGKIVIFNSSGTLVKEIAFPELHNPSGIAISHDSKSFFVSNTEIPFMGSKPTAVYKLNFEGSVVATYTDKDLSDIEGLTVTRDGTLLVCNWSYPGSIHVVSPECKKIKEILPHNQHIRYPYCASYCDDTNKLLVCSHIPFKARNDNLNDTLKVFQMC